MRYLQPYSRHEYLCVVRIKRPGIGLREPTCPRSRCCYTYTYPLLSVTITRQTYRVAVVSGIKTAPKSVTPCSPCYTYTMFPSRRVLLVEKYNPHHFTPGSLHNMCWDLSHLFHYISVFRDLYTILQSKPRCRKLLQLVRSDRSVVMMFSSSMRQVGTSVSFTSRSLIASYIRLLMGRDL